MTDVEQHAVRHLACHAARLETDPSLSGVSLDDMAEAAVRSHRDLSSGASVSESSR